MLQKDTAEFEPCKPPWRLLNKSLCYSATKVDVEGKEDKSEKLPVKKDWGYMCLFIWLFKREFRLWKKVCKKNNWNFFLGYTFKNSMEKYFIYNTNPLSLGFGRWLIVQIPSTSIFIFPVSISIWCSKKEFQENNQINLFICFLHLTWTHCTILLMQNRRKAINTREHLSVKVCLVKKNPSEILGR